MARIIELEYWDSDLQIDDLLAYNNEESWDDLDPACSFFDFLFGHPHQTLVQPATIGQFKPILLRGVGEVKVIRPDGFLRLGKIQDLRITFDQRFAKHFGGDGISALETYAQERAISFVASEATFDMEMLVTVFGDSILVNQETIVDEFNESHSVLSLLSNQIILDHEDVIPFSERVYDAKTYMPFTRGDSPAPGIYSIAGNVLSFHESDSGKQILVDYEYRVNGVDVCNITVTSMPTPVEIRYKFRYRDYDNCFKVAEIFIFKARIEGPFELNFSRGVGSVQNLVFTVLNPDRPDKKIIKIIRSTTL